ncbi:MAG: Mur ligase family protein, partial [Methylococcales bacterium]
MALRGRNADGNAFVGDALAKGAMVALCADRARDSVPRDFHDRVLWVADPVLAMQRIAGAWRGAVACPVLAITGSNGKTIVKDMVSRLVAGRYGPVYTSPASFNSRVGISLSLARVPREAGLVIQEVGVPDLGEMRAVRSSLNPTCGVLTNLGMAHIGRFGTREALLREKLELFAGLPPESWLLAPDDEFVLGFSRSSVQCRVVPIGSRDVPRLRVIDTLSTGSTRVAFSLHDQAIISAIVPFAAAPLLQDLELAVVTAFLLDVPLKTIQDRIADIRIAPTRLEVWQSPNQITLVNDAVSADPLSVGVALGFAASLGEVGAGKTFIFGGMREMGARQSAAFAEVGASAAHNGFSRLILVEDEFTLDDTANTFKHLAGPDAEVL